MATSGQTEWKTEKQEHLLTTASGGEPIQITNYTPAHKVTLTPLNYLRSTPGSSARSKLVKAFNYWCKVPEDIVKEIGDIIELVHDASLLIDDVQDGAKIRRGQVAAHIIYGIPFTMNSAMYALFSAMDRTLKLKGGKGMQICVKHFLECLAAVGLEMYCRDEFICPTTEEYLEAIVKKTGSQFLLPLQLLQEFSEDKRDFDPLVINISRFFTIRNDFMNLKDNEYCNKKNFCEDIEEGKFSFPIIHAIKTNPGDQRLINILRQRTKDSNMKREFLLLLDQYGSFEYTQSFMNQLLRNIREQIFALGGNPLLEIILEQLASSIFKPEEEKIVQGEGSTPCCQNTFTK